MPANFRPSAASIALAISTTFGVVVTPQRPAPQSISTKHSICVPASTAPFERLAVRSYVAKFDEITIKEAIKSKETISRKISVGLNPDTGQPKYEDINIELKDYVNITRNNNPVQPLNKNISDNLSSIYSRNKNILSSNVSLVLDTANYNFDAQLKAQENLRSEKNSDRYSYQLPHYNFSKNFYLDSLPGVFNFDSIASQALASAGASKPSTLSLISLSKSVNLFSDILVIQMFFQFMF